MTAVYIFVYCRVNYAFVENKMEASDYNEFVHVSVSFGVAHRDVNVHASYTFLIVDYE